MLVSTPAKNSSESTKAEMDVTEQELGYKETETDKEGQGSSKITVGTATDFHGIGDQFALSGTGRPGFFFDSSSEISL